MEHSRYPQNSQALQSFTHSVEFKNRSCGDEVLIQLLVKKNRIEALAIVVEGCSLARAGGSVLSGLIKDKSFPCRISQFEIASVLGLGGVRRADCLLLSLNALKKLYAQTIPSFEQMDDK